jgi:glycosyltransferase involved in cell wall biosynthesis
MVDLATLKGLHPRLANIPCLYYFHENQFAYPPNERQVVSVEPLMVQLYGALAADKLLFNSYYNKESFLSGVEKLLAKFPDAVPEGIVPVLNQKSTVLPVVLTPLESREDKNNKLILWNHRWEYDKAPQVFAEALMLLNKINPGFELALLGHRSRVKHEALHRIEQHLGDKIIVNGKVCRDQYQNLVAQSAIVVSTAIHEFQGLSMLEAVSAGAVPLMPDDLCYREQYAEQYRYKAGDSQALAHKLAEWLRNLPPAPDVSYWYGRELLHSWKQLLQSS